MEKPIAAIELGSKKAKLVVGYELNGKPHVLYTLVKPYGGQMIENGNFMDFNKVIGAITGLTSLVDPSVKLKLNISDIILSLPPYGLDVLRTRQTTGTTSEDAKISNFDIKNLYSIIRNCNPGSNNALVDIVPHTFILDQGRSFRNAPIGESSRTLTIVANVHSLPKNIVSDYTNVIQHARMSVRRKIISTFAAKELLSTDSTIPQNYWLVDIGSNTCTLSLIGNKELFSSTSFDWGGDNITQKIVASFNINEADAEKYKITYGIDKQILNFKAPVCVTTSPEGEEIKHYTNELNQIIYDELDTFIEKLNKAFDELLVGLKTQYKTLPLVLIGGGSRLHGLVDYIQPKLQNEKIQLYCPSVLGARNATFTNCLGMILVCSKYPTMFDDNSRSRVGPLTRESLIISDEDDK